MINNFRLKFAIILTLSVFGTSCISVKSKVKGKENELNVNTPKVYIRPLLADIKVENTKKEASFYSEQNISETEIRNSVLNIFLELHQCDFIVDPVYTFSEAFKLKKRKSVSVKLTGYPAKYINFHQVDSLPKSIIESNRIPVIEPRTKQITTDKKSNRKEQSNSKVKEKIELNSKIGIDATLGNIIHGQIDYPVLNNSIRAFFSFESVLDNGTSIRARINSKDLSSKKGPIQIKNASIGISKKFRINDFFGIRTLCGLNSKYYAFPAITAKGVDLSHIQIYGIHTGISLDLKIIKKMYLIGKVQYNFDILPKAKYTISNVRVYGTSIGYAGLGLRYII
jgi:hypothetical protein